MKKQTSILTKHIEDKTIVWFEASNQYVVLENQTAEIVAQLNANRTATEIAENLSLTLTVPLNAALALVLDLEKNVFLPNLNKTKSKLQNNHIKKPTHYKYLKTYLINDLIFLVAYQTEENLYFVHPKFAHLEVSNSAIPDVHFEVFTSHQETFLWVDDELIGSWDRKDIHYFQGKFSMKIVEKMHQKKETDWLGVFHASAVSNEKQSMLFLGDSGNGKSTSLALLQAHGFTCLADDFVPIDAKNKEVYSFPSAISIKKNSVPTLRPLYPELENSAEYHFERLQKIVRYLPPKNANYKNHLPCKALVFIKYKKDSPLHCKAISKLDAFQKLVPDSWLSPKKENAQLFLDWFSELPCYVLTYANNEEMLTTVHKIFNDEL